MDVLEALKNSKGNGTWPKVAGITGIRYDTLVRIARQEIKTPSVQKIEAIGAALEKLGAAKKRKTAKA